MYERAGSKPAGADALWRLVGAQTFFVGPLGYNAPHSHGAPVYLAGVYGTFRLRIGPEPWTSCRSAMIPAGVPHELELGGEPLAVLYLEPGAGGVDALVPLVRDSRELGGALLGRHGETDALRAMWEDRASLGWVDEALGDLVGFGRRQAGRHHAERRLDPRIARSIDQLLEAGEQPRSAATLAADLGLSVSRFQHLFTADIGVPFRRYRAWLRMRRAIHAIVAGDSFTGAAHTAGFADQAHFAHDFRRTFGAPASVSLIRVRRAG